MKIHTGDNVVVITGKDKGKTGSVMKVLPVTGRIVVSGINMRTKHIKATPQQAGQKIQYEGSVSISNVMVVDAKSKKRTRVGFEIDGKGKKKRIAKRSGEVIEKKKVAAKSVRQTQDEKESPAFAETTADKPKAEEDVKVKKVKEEKGVKEPSFAKASADSKAMADKSDGKEKIEEKPFDKARDKKPEKTEQVAVPPSKKPFWKKMLSFGGAAADEAEVEGESHMKENHSIPGETPPNRRNTTRGA